MGHRLYNLSGMGMSPGPHVGFTGTQLGMTLDQKRRVEGIIQSFSIGAAHHGDCIGADAEFHTICRGNRLHIVGHPPLNPSKRAFCDFDEERDPKDYIPRNHDIVDESHFMIATPREFGEVLRSGTWATIRYSNRIGKPIVVILPDGSTWNGKTTA